MTVVGYELVSIIFVAMRRDRSRELSRARVERFDDGTLEGCRLHVQLGDVHDSVPEPGEFDSAAEFLEASSDAIFYRSFLSRARGVVLARGFGGGIFHA